MQTVNIVTSLVNYRHSGQGYLSLSFRSSMSQSAVPSILRRFLLGGGGKVPIGLSFDDIKFRGYLQSVVPKGKHLTMTVRIKPSKFLVMRFYERVGKPGQILLMDLPGYGEYLSREDYYALKKRVESLLNEYCFETNTTREEVLLRLTSRTSLNRMSPTYLRRVEKELRPFFEKEDYDNPEGTSHYPR